MFLMEKLWKKVKITDLTFLGQSIFKETSLLVF